MKRNSGSVSCFGDVKKKHRTMKSIWKGNDQELIQSNPTPNPQNQKGKKHTHKFINVHKRHAQ